MQIKNTSLHLILATFWDSFANKKPKFDQNCFWHTKLSDVESNWFSMKSVLFYKFFKLLKKANNQLSSLSCILILANTYDLDWLHRHPACLKSLLRLG